MIKILKYLNQSEWLMMAASLVFVAFQVWLDLRIPDYMAEITELTQTPGAEMARIWENGGYMLLCALGGVFAAVVCGFFTSRIGASFSRRLRSLLFNKVESFSMEEINRFSTSSLITRSTNDITQVQMLIVMGTMLIFRAPIMAFMAISKILGRGVEWSMVTAGSIAIVFVMVIILMIFVVPRFRMMQQLTDNITRVTRENLSGVRVVRAYNAEDYQEKKFADANDELTDTQLFTSRAMAVMMPIMNLVMGGMSLAIYWLGAYLIDGAEGLAQRELFGNMVVFMQYSVQVIMAFMMLVMIFIMLPRANVAAKRINEVLDTEPMIVGRDKDCSQGEKPGEIVFDKVFFRYPDADEDTDYVLSDVSFTVKNGETVAFIGSTGSGKSTVIKLIPRFYDATEGEVLVNGRNVKEYSLESLYNIIGYVPQKAVLFKGSVASNVAYGDNGRASATDEEIKEAIGIAQSMDFVEAMEGGLLADVAQGGTNLSGGQKQRLAIARAICRKPQFYIFDDSFSALDYKTDLKIRTQLKAQTAGVTTLIVAQRIGTIMDADQIIVLDEGKVVGIGKHRELLSSCEVYREIALSQLSEEELDGDSE